ncbi:MAG: tRNA pseudouridine(55) synthase TruB [Acidobacteriota bacterium]
MSLPSGVLVADKPAGPTSHDIVQAVRGFTKGLRVGHTGTLDPFATGVLPLCIGRATRLSRFLSATRKSYAGVILLGVATDTYDSQGRIVSHRPIDEISESMIRRMASRFTGTFSQVPPPFSARKLRGQPAHRLARRGMPVDLAPSLVTVHRFDIDEIAGPAVRFRIETSPGTYIRSIAHDLGLALGCGAHLAELRRTAAGRLQADDAHPFEAILEAGRAGHLDEMIVPMRRLDLGLPFVTVTPEGRLAVRSGRPLARAHLSSAGQAGAGGQAATRVLDEQGDLIAIAAPAGSPDGEEVLKPIIVLAT